MKKGDCGICEKRSTCKELCKEAEKYVNQDDRGNDVLTHRHYFSISVNTNVDYSDLINEIAERKKDEIIYYFQQIQNMPDSAEKVVIGLMFLGMPYDRIAKYMKMSWQNVYALLKKLEQQPNRIIKK